jgi:16S rRNA (cytosine967-C5)-methyltransferase
MKKVKENLTRLGIINVRCVVGDATDLGAWLQRPFPRILLDVPCSNTGELSRRVEVRLRLRENDIAGLAGMQGRLLGAAAPLLSPGGILVYCTCSLEEEEGPGVVQAFLRSAEGGYALDREDWFLPHRCGGTGGYAARIVRLAHVGQETTTDS